MTDGVKNIRVEEKDVNKYLKLGYKIGLNSVIAGKIFINNGIDMIFISPEDLYL